MHIEKIFVMTLCIKKILGLVKILHKLPILYATKSILERVCNTHSTTANISFWI